MTNSLIPFNDLNRIHRKISSKVFKEIKKLVDESNFILGDYVECFETQFALYTQSKFAIGCANGTDAIELVLRALKIGIGDEVIVQTNTFIATALAVKRSGATPVFIDNNRHYLINTSELNKKISKKTKAVISVNLYGQLGDNIYLRKFCKKNNLYFIEDSAQAHGAKQFGKSPGQYSIASTYSFYPGKNLGGWGDGGCITTNNKAIYEKLKLIRNWGSKEKYKHSIVGYNSRLDPIQAAVLIEKLKYLDEWNAIRNEIALIYSENLKSNFILPSTVDGNYHIWHQYVVRTKNRDQIIDFGKKNGIEFGIHYPKPINKQLAFKSHQQYQEKFENSDSFYKNLLSLPIFPYMTKKETFKVIKFLNAF